MSTAGSFQAFGAATEKKKKENSLDRGAKAGTYWKLLATEVTNSAQYDGAYDVTCTQSYKYTSNINS